MFGLGSVITSWLICYYWSVLHGIAQQAATVQITVITDTLESTAVPFVMYPQWFSHALHVFIYLLWKMM